MGPLAYHLCQKEAVGLAMWLAGLCAFPPPLPASGISLASTGPVLSREFEVPVSKTYLLHLDFVFPSTEARLEDRRVGQRYAGAFCQANLPFEAIPESERSGLGLPIPLHVVVHRRGESVPVIDRTFHSLCVSSHIGNRKGRNAGALPLDAGAYRITVHNLAPQPEFADVEVLLSVVSGGAK